MPSSSETLEAVVDHVLGRCGVRYGTSWLAKWEGLDPELVRADWREQLECFVPHPRVVSWALTNLPLDYPPNAGQFRELCREAPEACWDRPKALPEPDLPGVEPGARARVEAIVAEASARPKSPIWWIENLMVKQRRGEPLSPAQKRALAEARQTLTGSIKAGEGGGAIKPISPEKLPPGMRPLPDGRPQPPEPQS